MASVQRILRRLRGGAEQPQIPADMDHAFGPAYELAAEFTMTTVDRMYALWQATHYVVSAAIPGDLVECGVWRGGSAMLTALALRDAGASRKIWLYDTFEGMPPPSDRDREEGGTPAADRLAAEPRVAGAFNTWAFATLDDVKAQMARTGESDVRYVRGRVEDTIPAEVPAEIGLLRLDTDWYASTKHELEHLWPRLSEGGVLIVDDYGYWQGARDAVDEYFRDRDLHVLLHRIDESGRIAIKVSP
jgi:O-methyltransferase